MLNTEGHVYVAPSHARFSYLDDTKTFPALPLGQDYLDIKSGELVFGYGDEALDTLRQQHRTAAKAADVNVGKPKEKSKAKTACKMDLHVGAANSLFEVALFPNDNPRAFGFSLLNTANKQTPLRLLGVASTNSESWHKSMGEFLVGVNTSGSVSVRPSGSVQCLDQLVFSMPKAPTQNTRIKPLVESRRHWLRRQEKEHKKYHHIPEHARTMLAGFSNVPASAAGNDIPPCFRRSEFKDDQKRMIKAAVTDHQLKNNWKKMYDSDQKNLLTFPDSKTSQIATILQKKSTEFCIHTARLMSATQSTRKPNAATHSLLLIANDLGFGTRNHWLKGRNTTASDKQLSRYRDLLVKTLMHHTTATINVTAQHYVDSKKNLVGIVLEPPTGRRGMARVWLHTEI